MTEQVVQIPFVTTGFIKFAPMLLRYKTGYRQQELVYAAWLIPRFISKMVVVHPPPTATWVATRLPVLIPELTSGCKLLFLPYR